MKEVSDESGECADVLRAGGENPLIVEDPLVVDDILEYVDYIATID